MRCMSSSDRHFVIHTCFTILLIAACSLVCEPSFSQSKRSSKSAATKSAKPRPVRKSRKKKSQTAIVAVEGAAFYKYPNFDAQVLEYVRAGTKVKASLKPRAGIGGFGAFFKVKLPSGKVGWMTDVDVLPQYKVKNKSGSQTQTNPDFNKANDIMENAGRDQIYFERYVGANLAYVNFSEKFDKGTLSSNTPMFGVRGVGPDLFFGSPPLDFSFQFSLEAPRYYSDFASGDATGFFVIADALFPFPFWSSDSYYFGLGLGPMLTYTNFAVQVRSSEFDSQELRIGAVADLAAMFRYKKFAVKIDYKYYYEVTQYGGLNLSFLFNVR